MFLEWIEQARSKRHYFVANLKQVFMQFTTFLLCIYQVFCCILSVDKRLKDDFVLQLFGKSGQKTTGYPFHSPRISSLIRCNLINTVSDKTTDSQKLNFVDISLNSGRDLANHYLVKRKCYRKSRLISLDVINN